MENESSRQVARHAKSFAFQFAPEHFPSVCYSHPADRVVLAPAAVGCWKDVELSCAPNPVPTQKLWYLLDESFSHKLAYSVS